MMPAKFMPPRVCLQLETLALIMCYDASFNNQSSSFSFITKSTEFFFASFRRLSPDECRTKSLDDFFAHSFNGPKPL